MEEFVRRKGNLAPSLRGLSRGQRDWGSVLSMYAILYFLIYHSKHAVQIFVNIQITESDHF